MKFLNVDIPVKNLPELDQGFVPLGLFFKEYSKNATKPLCIAVERSGGQVGVYAVSYTHLDVYKRQT